MSWIWSALMPHPPILVPEVGQGREREAAETLRGGAELTDRVNGQKPDVLLILSPHQPYVPGALFLNASTLFKGSFAPFGALGVVLSPASKQRDQETLNACLSSAGIPVYTRSSPDLRTDQGTTVPLYFLRRAWEGDLPPVVLASPIGLTPEQAFEMGRGLARLNDGRRWALLASGDLSHRLTPDAPAGYSPEDGPAFDAAVEDALRQGSPQPLLDLGEDRIENAGECGLRSVMAMLGLIGELGGNIQILSHEGPFGVGYCNALWLAPEGLELPAAAQVPAPVRLARETVTRLLSGRPLPESGDEVVPSPLWKERRACFVSIKQKSGALRGCIGTLSPTWPSLDREIIENAVLASTRDPRFPPMKAGELAGVVFSVDVLSEPEPVEGMSQLDPKIFGVIVSRGMRRGVLLPDLEGVDTVEQQVAIAAQKAGLYSPASPGGFDPDGMQFERFRVERHREPPFGAELRG
ncbi:MAG: AmmeMemoRadiSam system protein A [Fretibacterium sp.]|nr:AmmeMemoRadiSam system protein A [Fretibacterium sp.]